MRGTRTELILAACNLLANALKYTDEGGRVHVGLSESDGHAQLVIADDGLGLGLGLGLGIVSRIVARHQGHITLDSATPGRTVFTMTLPVDDG